MSNIMQTKDKGGIDDLVQLVSFKLGKEEFGIDILQVQEINRMVEITQIPDAPSYVEGIINLRDKVIPVIDLRKKLGLEATEHCKETRIVVMDVNGRMTYSSAGCRISSVNRPINITVNNIKKRIIKTATMLTKNPAMLTKVVPECTRQFFCCDP